MTTRSKATAQPADAQTETVTGDVFEVLTEDATGHRTIHRVRGGKLADAESRVTETVPEGTRILGSSVAGCGLGSG